MAMPNAGKLKKKIVDGRDGMGDETRRHFNEVKQNMFAFINHLHPGGIDRNRRAATPAFRDKIPVKTPQHHVHWATPQVQRKQPQIPWNPHAGLATPHVGRRLRK